MHLCVPVCVCVCVCVYVHVVRAGAQACVCMHVDHCQVTWDIQVMLLSR